MKMPIHRTELREVIENVQGNKGLFGRIKPYKPGTTEPWLQLEKIGLSSISFNANFTGSINLYIRRSGILNIGDLGKLPMIMEKELDTVPNEIRFRYPKNKYAEKDLAKIM